jgi:hypothetical protein
MPLNLCICFLVGFDDIAVVHHCVNIIHAAYNSMVAWNTTELPLMTHKYRGCIVVLSINKSVEPNEEQKVLTSGVDQGFTVNTSKRVFRGIW